MRFAYPLGVTLVGVCALMVSATGQEPKERLRDAFGGSWVQKGWSILPPSARSHRTCVWRHRLSRPRYPTETTCTVPPIRSLIRQVNKTSGAISARCTAMQTSPAQSLNDDIVLLRLNNAASMALAIHKTSSMRFIRSALFRLHSLPFLTH